MGSLWADDVCKKAEEWIGYHEGSNNWTIFAKILDDCGYYAPQTKQNVPWCASFCNCMALISALPKDRDDEAKKYDAQYFLFQPSYNNYSASAPLMAGYFKNAGEFYTSNPQIGDMCFFNVDGDIGHVGIVVDTEDYITTIEGNAGDEVQKKWYSYDDIGGKIAGFGRPRYDGLYNPDNISHEPEKEDKPVKEDNKVKGVEYRVCVGSFLNIRNGHSTDYEKIGELYDGAIVLVYEKIDGWGRIGVNMWVAMDYLDEI